MAYCLQCVSRGLHQKWRVVGWPRCNSIRSVLRRSHDRATDLGPLFLVSAWAVQRGISLGQLATQEKSNEITAIPELLDQIEIKDSVVTIDAAGCQKASLFKQVDDKESIAMRRRMAGWNPNFLAQVVGIPTT